MLFHCTCFFIIILYIENFQIVSVNLDLVFTWSSFVYNTFFMKFGHFIKSSMCKTPQMLLCYILKFIKVITVAN